MAYLVAREYQGIGQDNILSSASGEDHDFSNVIRSKRLAATEIKY